MQDKNNNLLEIDKVQRKINELKTHWDSLTDEEKTNNIPYIPGEEHYLKHESIWFFK